MDELDDLAAFGLAEIDEDRAAGEWADPHAPEVGTVLTTAQAVALETDVVLYGNELSRTSHDQAGALARTLLAWAPVVQAVGPLADALAVMWEADPTRRPDGGPAVDFVAAVRAYRAAGGDA